MPENRYFVKIYGKIIDSSLWEEEPEARLVFLGMCALAGPDGVVSYRLDTTLARRLNLDIEYLRRGLAVLMAPDARSENREHEGRRIVQVEQGWQIVSYQHYRELRTERQEANRLQMQEARQRAKAPAAKRPRPPRSAKAIERAHVEHMGVMTSNKSIVTDGPDKNNSHDRK